MKESIKLGDLVYLTGLPDNLFRIISEEKITSHYHYPQQYYDVIDLKNDQLYIVFSNSIQKFQKPFNRFENLDI